VQEESSEGEKWVSLRVRSPVELQDALANFLVEQTGRGVQLEGDWIRSFCRRGLEAETCLRQLGRYCQALRQIYPDRPELVVVQENTASKDWAEAWKTFFKPIRIGKTLVVKPTWEPYQASGGRVIIEIDPGRAFGTGKHPSTALCVEILEKVLSDTVPSRMESGPSVLDVGTGTGILGIVAARLGARRVLGLDIDPEALEAAELNMIRNRVQGIMRVSGTPMEQVMETFDLVTANLTADSLMAMAVNLASRVNTRGHLLISGILAEQEEEVSRCFGRHNLELLEKRALDEWRAMLLRRKSQGVVGGMA
jgi:ribosomal protein L11 methyltransferase